MQTSYNGGELSQRMEGRVDQAIYGIAAAEMLNFVPTVEGPAIKRPGFRFIRPAAATATWLSEFIFSRTQAYVLEWSEGKLRFYTNGGRIETNPTTPYEVTVPYTAAQAKAVSQQQSYDRLYLAHGAHAPASLLRLTATTFSHAALNLINGPFADRNGDEAVTVTVGGVLTVGGVATVTASAPIFLAGHVGAKVMVEAKDFSDVAAWEVGIDGITSGTTRMRSDGKVYLAASSGRTGSVQPTHSRGTESDGTLAGQDVNAKGPYGVKWTYEHDRFGIGTITAIGGGGTTATVTVTRRFPSTLATIASHRWSLPAFYGPSNWPKIVLLAFGRLIFFTDFEIIASVVADYGGGNVNMAPFNEGGVFTSDMAFRRRLDISNPILWAKADRDAILIGTADGEHAIKKINSAELFASDNLEVVRQSRYGAADVQPAQTGTTTIFVQKNGRKLREANYSLQSDRYEAPNIAIWQRHVLKSGAKQLTFQQEPEELLWAVRNDGLMALHPHVPEQEIKGFARLQHGGGSVVSAIAIPSQDGTLDELWALVNSGGALSIEQQAPFWEEGETALEEAFFVDSGVTVDNPVSLTLTGATWLANKQVAVLADGAVLPLQTVAADGSLNLSAVLSSLPTKVTLGRPFQARLKWLRPEVRGPNGGTIQGKIKRLVKIVLRLLDTALVKVDPGNQRPENMINRPGSAPMNAPVPLFTGDTSARAVSGGYDRDGQGTIISDDPVPCIVVAHMPTVTFEGAA